MIEINYLHKDLLESIKNEIIKNKISAIDLSLMKAIFNLFKNIDFYVFDQHYQEYIDLSKYDTDNILTVKNDFAVEINHYHYELLGNNTEVKHYYPLIYLCINDKEKLNILSKVTGIDISGTLILIFRKLSNNWEMPSFGTCLNKNKNKIEVKNIEIFKKRFNDFEINAKKEDFEEIVNFLNYDCYKKYNDFNFIINYQEFDNIIINEDNLNYKTINKFLVKKSVFINKELKRDKTKQFKHSMNYLSKFSLIINS